jgi:hypothetical protein
MSDGTVAAWGSDAAGQCDVPTGLTGVVAVAAGGWHSVALKSDGTVLVWGGGAVQLAVPAGLSGVVAIAAGSEHTLALKGDGSVIAWGWNAQGQSQVPTDLQSAIGVSAGLDHSLALGWIRSSITSPLTVRMTINETFSYQITGSYAPTTFDASGLPAGLTFDPASATISGSVATAGSYAITLSATNFVGTSSASLTLLIDDPNQPPSFIAGPDIVVFEDMGFYWGSGWATACSAGPGEGWQTVSYEVTTDNPGLFWVSPFLYGFGTVASLEFYLAPNANGVAHVTVIAHDDGGTAAGGIDTSAPQTFTITVDPVNDAPSFAKGPDQVINHHGSETVVGWATALSAGPADEAGQALSFIVSNDNNAMFSVQPAVTPDGTLTFTPQAIGSATVSVQIKDDAGTANGGVDTSGPQTFTITVTAMNQAPIAADASASTTMGVPISATLAATDVDGDPLTFHVVAGPAHGSLSLSGTTATYTSETGYVGIDTFTYRANDGTVDSNIATVSITVTTPTGRNPDDRIGTATPEVGGNGCGLGGGIGAVLASLMLAGARRQRRGR